MFTIVSPAESFSFKIAVLKRSQRIAKSAGSATLKRSRIAKSADSAAAGKSVRARDLAIPSERSEKVLVPLIIYYLIQGFNRIRCS
jgi:hypothetical protein